MTSATSSAGSSLAYMGRRAEAMREGERGLALAAAGDQREGHYLQRQVARIYMLSGEPEKALDQLEPLVQDPTYLTPGWLRIDPNVRAAPGQSEVRAAG